MTVFIVLLLWLFFSGLIFLIVRHKKISLSLSQVIVFFGCKIAAGGAYGYLFKKYYNGDDTWGLNHDALIQYQRLLHAPATFFNIFSRNPSGADGTFYFNPSTFLENLEYTLITKMIAVFDLATRGNYYVNMVLFNFIGFWGLYFFYKLIALHLPTAAHRVTSFVIFLFPPALFWLSGIRAEAILMLATGLLLYFFYRWMRERRLQQLIVCLVCLALSFVLRYGFALSLLPALAAWWWQYRFKSVAWKTFCAAQVMILIALLLGTLLPPEYNALVIITNRQHDFFTLTGNTRFNLTPLTYSPISFIQVLPEAFMNTFIRPLPWEAKGPLQWFASAENIFVLVLIGAAVRAAIKKTSEKKSAAFCWMLVTVAIANYLLAGYTVPFPGAIVRYKIIPELFFVAACLLYLAPQSFTLQRRPGRYKSA